MQICGGDVERLGKEDLYVRVLAKYKCMQTEMIGCGGIGPLYPDVDPSVNFVGFIVSGLFI